MSSLATTSVTHDGLGMVESAPGPSSWWPSVQGQVTPHQLRHQAATEVLHAGHPDSIDRQRAGSATLPKRSACVAVFPLVAINFSVADRGLNLRPVDPEDPLFEHGAGLP